MIGNISNEVEMASSFMELVDSAKNINKKNEQIIIPREASRITYDNYGIYGWVEESTSLLCWLINLGNVSETDSQVKYLVVYGDGYIYSCIGNEWLKVYANTEVGNVRR